MKWILVVAALLIQLTAGAAFAVPVDFSSLGPPANDPPLTVDITTPNSITLSGVTLTYDNYGSTHPFDTAIVDPSGVYGSTYGALNLGFAGGATSLSFDFALFGVPPTDPAVAAVFDNGDIITLAGLFAPYDSGNPSLGDILGSFGYFSSSVFTTASILFSPVVDPGGVNPDEYVPYFFNVSNIDYEPVPEPSTMVLLAAGLFGLGGWRFVRRKA